MECSVSYEKERAVAVEAVRQACRLCQAVRATLISDETMAKKDRSPVTVADFGAQAVVVSIVLGAFAGQNIVGEEEATELRTEAGRSLKDKVVRAVRAVAPGLGEREVLAAIDHAIHPAGPTGRYWTLDPIDGTKGFLRGEQYAVALALIEEGRVVLGVLGCPNLPVVHTQPDGPHGCLFVAVRGAGAVMCGLDEPAERPIAVSSVTEAAAASFCESVESGHSAHDRAAVIARQLGVSAPPVRMDSQCKYAAVARGDASVYLRLPTKSDYEEKIWDHAAGWIVVKEAGGQVTDVRGEPLDFSLGRTLRNNKGVVATNGRLHDQIIAAVREVLGV